MQVLSRQHSAFGPETPSHPSKPGTARYRRNLDLQTVTRCAKQERSRLLRAPKGGEQVRDDTFFCKWTVGCDRNGLESLLLSSPAPNLSNGGPSIRRRWDWCAQPMLFAALCFAAGTVLVKV